MTENHTNGTSSENPRRDLLAELVAFEKLEIGWNGYSAPAPSRVAIDNARGLIQESLAANLNPERIEPSVMGGIGVTYSAGNREVVVELYNSGTAHALFADNQTEEMETRTVSVCVDGYRVLLDVISAHWMFGG